MFFFDERLFSFGVYIFIIGFLLILSSIFLFLIGSYRGFSKKSNRFLKYLLCFSVAGLVAILVGAAIWTISSRLIIVDF